MKIRFLIINEVSKFIVQVFLCCFAGVDYFRDRHVGKSKFSTIVGKSEPIDQRWGNKRGKVQAGDIKIRFQEETSL